MGRRSRSKSPGFSRRREQHRGDKERERDKEFGFRDFDRERDRHRRKRSRSRDRSRREGERRRFSRSRSRSRSIEAPRQKQKSVHHRPAITAADLEGKSPEEQEMIKMMGFGNFDTTKGKKVDGNDVGEVHVILKRKYRQYMNRKGGFNRPLDFVA